jgi:hypothetical protein
MGEHMSHGHETPTTPAEHWRAVGAATAANNRSLGVALSDAPGQAERDWVRQGHDTWRARNSDAVPA